MRKPQIYLDNCSFNRPFDDQTQMRIHLETQAKLFIQKLIREKFLTLAVSYVSYYENWDSPHTRNKITIEKFFEHAAIFVDIDKEIVIEQKANDIKKYGVKANDALHIACAIEAECDYFITTDDGILKKCKTDEIKVCSPIEFVTIWEVLT